MFVVHNLIQEYLLRCLVGHPYLASLLLGFSICEALAPKRVLRRSLALFCLLQGYFQLFGISVNKGVQRFLCYLRTHSRVWRGSRHLVLYIMDPIQIIANIDLQSILNRIECLPFFSFVDFLSSIQNCGLSSHKILGENLKVKNCILHNSVVVATVVVVSVVVASQKIYRRQFLIIFPRWRRKQ